MTRSIALALTLLTVPAFAGDDFAFWPGAEYDPAVPTFEAVLGHAPGDEITPPADVVRYFQALAAAVPGQVQLTEYATSWEGRPLIYAAVGSAEHIARLDDLRSAVQALADPRRTDAAAAKRLIADTPAAVWLAYAVHGNELSSTDAAMLTAYHLLASQDDPVVEKILAETVVFIDPLQNPDGRARFVHGFEAARGLAPDADPLSAEHVEPWPSGRVNHYLFDMNRDWIALTQPETRGRIAALLEWYPLVFVDLHEMGSNATYYFAPEAVPYNPHIAADQRSSLELFGRNNARWFDRYGIDYFTREVFDAFYPGYGASWPLYYGAVAMTYEQASSRGLVMRRRNGSELPYRETVRNHFVTSISTAEAAAENRERLLSDFYDYRASAVEAGKSGSERTYLLSGGGDPTTADKLAGVLVQQGIEVERARAGFTACGKTYPAGSYAVDLAQPAHRLIRTLLDPQVPMEEDFLAEQERRRAKDLDHEIYDITAWSLALMWNVELVACDRAVAGDFEPAGPETVRPGTLGGDGATVAYLVPWGTQAAARLLAGALRADLAVKTSDKAFRQAGREYPAGTLIFKVPDNPGDLAERLAELARDTGAEVVGTSDSWVDEGPNFGSMNVFDVPAPRIAIVWEAPASAYSAGNARFVVERLLDYPVSAVRGRTLAGADLRRFDVVILPEGAGRRYGSYEQVLGQRGADNLKEWVAEGGTLVVLGNAMGWAADPEVDLVAARRQDAFRETSDKEKKAGRSEAEGRTTVPGTLLADEAALATAVEPERQAPDSVPGALVKAAVDPDHWLAAGVTATVPVMVRGSDVYAPLTLDQGTNVAAYAGADELLLSGYLWSENRRQMAFKPFLLVQPRGRGFVVGFTEDPTFRAYMDGLNLLLANALFRAPAHARPVR